MMISTPAVEKWRECGNKMLKEWHDAGWADEAKWIRALWTIESNEIEQMIASLFPDEFPEYPEDWGTLDRCIGEHVPLSLIDKVCDEVIRLRAIVEGVGLEY